MYFVERNKITCCHDPVEGAHSRLFDVTGDLAYLPLGLKPMHRPSFLPTAIFILRGKKKIVGF